MEAGITDHWINAKSRTKCCIGMELNLRKGDRTECRERIRGIPLGRITITITLGAVRAVKFRHTTVSTELAGSHCVRTAPS